MRSVTLKSAITPSFIGRMATMLPGVRPSISLASLPTASTSPLFLLIATIEGSLTTIPFPFAKTRVLAVPRSIARSDENRLNSDRRFIFLGSESTTSSTAYPPKVPHGETVRQYYVLYFQSSTAVTMEENDDYPPDTFDAVGLLG